MAKNTTWDTLHETALKAPQSSGVYLWRNAENTVIYVGKAKNLKNRLCSYFSGQKSIKTKMLIAHAVLIEYITTTNEYEALLLETVLVTTLTLRMENLTRFCALQTKSFRAFFVPAGFYRTALSITVRSRMQMPQTHFWTQFISFFLSATVRFCEKGTLLVFTTT